MWSGIPSWSGLIDELAQFVEATSGNAELIRSEAANGDLLQAASYGFDKLTKYQIGELIRKVCRYGSAQPHEIHRKIVSLGPRCFITTNYDNLIEESLRKWQPDWFFPPAVTNRHLTETAEIVNARAINFIFKPHGDAGDSDSIILTREQYRQLLPGGERQAALESMKMLLVSRPVIYLGFGLHDPDFLYLRDILANTYKGGTRDHYAIMADVTDAEVDYWRRNYGIHLVAYSTIEREDKSRDHTPLLTLLDSYLDNPSTSPTAAGFVPDNPDIVLALARYSAGLTRSPILSREFKLRVHAEPTSRDRSGIYFSPDRFDHCVIDKFLDSGPERALLIGLPGAGKSYSLRRAAARLAERLHDACLMEPFEKESIVLPIFADLKLYEGDLGNLVNGALPNSLPLNELTRHFKVKIFLDSFNEMPREYWENGSYESDFTTFINASGSSSFIIGSRTTDGLMKLGLPAYSLDHIDDDDLTSELQKLGIKIEGRFNREVLSLLRRPFYFHNVASRIVNLPADAHPRDLYQSLFENVNKSFEIRFGRHIDIKTPLSLTAYDALSRGEEAFPLIHLLRVLRSHMDASGVTDIDDRDIANWLVSISILIPYTGGRVAFVHQSVTEYLAAGELARLYQSNPRLLEEKLSLIRWDQALFLTLSLLPSSQAESFLQAILEADFVLAMNASKYLEAGREEVVSRLLSEIPKRIEITGIVNHKIESALRFGLPIAPSHEQLLRSVIACGNSIGGAAVLRLVDLRGAAVKTELIQMLVDYCDDFNFCVNGVAEAIRPFAEDDDATRIASLADSLQEKFKLDENTDDNDLDGFIYGASAFLGGLDLSVIRQVFLPHNGSTVTPDIHARIICDLLAGNDSTDALEFAGELLLQGISHSVFVIYMISEFPKTEHALSWASFTEHHVERLIFYVDHSKDQFVLGALRNLCTARADLALIVELAASKKAGIEKAALLYCLSPNNPMPLLESLSELITMNDEQRQAQPVHLLDGIDFDWAGNEEIFSKLIRLRDTRLMGALLGHSFPVIASDLGLGLGKLDIGPIDEWLEWMLEQDQITSVDWVLYQLGSLLPQVSDEIQCELIKEFNKSGSKYRPVLLQYVLPFFTNITTDVFDEDAISYLLASLARGESRSHLMDSVLGNTATERFINERLLPLLPNAQQQLLTNLRKVLHQAGDRHGRRYSYARHNSKIAAKQAIASENAQARIIRCANLGMVRTSNQCPDSSPRARHQLYRLAQLSPSSFAQACWHSNESARAHE